MPARFAAFLTLLLAALLALPAAAQDLPPRPDGPVYDGANMIDAATKSQLDQKLRAYNKETGRAVIVATVPSLDGETVEGYAVKLYETWGIGGEKTDEGALLLVAKEERKIRIEVGYGSTPTLTDAMSGRIIRDTITPAFKEGDFSAGIAAGVDRMIEAIDPKEREFCGELDAKLSWDQVRQLDEDPLFTLGGHGHTHRILSHLGHDELVEEVGTSLNLLKEAAGHPVIHYSYPEGMPDCYSPGVVRVLKQFGVRCCPTAIEGVNEARSDPFELRRIPVVR